MYESYARGKFILLSTICQAADNSCQSGTSVGYVTISAPNASSILTVGQPVEIQWKYTPAVKKLPSFMTIKIQDMGPQVATTWANVVENQLNVSGGLMAYTWTVPK